MAISVKNLGVWAALVFFGASCGGKGCGTSKEGATTAPQEAAETEANSDENETSSQDAASKKGLLLAYAQFESTPDGKIGTKPGAARLDILFERGGKWQTETIEDSESNVFHKAFFHKAGDTPGIITLGGMDAAVKLWERSKDKAAGKAGTWRSTTLWKEDFGGKWNRMRDAEVGILDGAQAIAVGTHDQGVVAILKSKGGKPKTLFETLRIDRTKDTFIHEIELGDLNKDGKNEIYATPSEPNKLSGDSPQKGEVVRYDPPFREKNQSKTVVADLGDRHAKEILVEDVDGDGQDELYVAVEALTERKGSSVVIKEPVEVRRYDADTPADKGVVVAKIDDRQCRFLTAGDFDGDGKKEMVAAAYKSGLWLLKPGSNAKASWKVSSIDRNSSGFEHAALAADLNGDKRSELYVATDNKGEVRRYTWKQGQFTKEVILKHKVPGSLLTWNIMVAPSVLLPQL